MFKNCLHGNLKDYFIFLSELFELHNRLKSDKKGWYQKYAFIWLKQQVRCLFKCNVCISVGVMVFHMTFLSFFTNKESFPLNYQIV